MLRPVLKGTTTKKKYVTQVHNNLTCCRVEGWLDFLTVANCVELLVQVRKSFVLKQMTRNGAEVNGSGAFDGIGSQPR